MNCPKCHTIVDDNATVCPKCHKVLQLECPNCKTLNESAICSKCGYTILVKCAKCSRINHIKDEYCKKCKFPTASSLAYQECESDEFASVMVTYESLKNIRRLLKSQELYSKFFNKLKNLLFAQLKGVDCKIITYGDTFVINFNKELSLATSSNKAVRLALKIANAFVLLNTHVQEELYIPLNLNLTITRKSSEQLQSKTTYKNNTKPLILKKNEKKYLNGLKIVLDQYIWDCVNKDFKTDSLYSLEDAGNTVMFYEIIPDSYILPPNENKDEDALNIRPTEIKRDNETEQIKDMYSFKVFDINAKSTFLNVPTAELLESLKNINLAKEGKIISLRSFQENAFKTSILVDYFKKEEFNVISVCCTEKMNYKPWGVFEEIFKSYLGVFASIELVNKNNLVENAQKRFRPLFDLLLKKPTKALTAEDARFAYMEEWTKFFASLDKTVIIIEGFEHLDDTSIQTLELYFDKFKNIRPNFVFITKDEVSVHSKIKGLLRTPLYTEFILKPSSIDSCLSTLKSDATDFIQSFYYEKIKESFKGSYLYFLNSIEYLKETGVLIEFEGKLLIKSKKSVIIPKDLKGLYKCRLKGLSKNMDLSLILAYMSMLSSRIDISTLKLLEIKDVEKNIKQLEENGLGYVLDNVLCLQNYNIITPVIQSSLKKDIEIYIAKTILAKIGKILDDTLMITLMGTLKAYKEEYLTLWKNAQFAIKTGDYDAYLKNCLGFLSLVDHIDDANLSKELIEENKKDVYNNILMFLYAYSPAKIYYIEKMLLVDALNQDDNDKIVKLSNLMLQGALISANYKDALGLLHNILTRMKNATLVVDGAVNTKFLLLSLVNIEILYNIGNFRECVEVAEDILSVLQPELLEKIKPASFSTNLFVNHILETFRLASLAKLYLLDDDIEDFFEKIKNSLNTELPEADCIIAILTFLAGKEYSIRNIELNSPYSKVVYLILQEFSILKDDYKRFAQNIYQAKLLASEIHQKELELLCDLLIGFAYFKSNCAEKAKAIFDDVKDLSEKSAMFNILMLANYMIAKVKFELNKKEEALILVNDSLASIQKQENNARILYIIFEKLYIEIAKETNLTPVNVEVETQKLNRYADSLARLI